MRVLQEIFAEVVDKHARVADRGRILDPQGRVIKDYSDTGVPAFLEFEMPVGADYFTLEVEGTRIHQGLFDRAHVPPAETAGSKPAPSPAAVAPIPESKPLSSPPKAKPMEKVD